MSRLVARARASGPSEHLHPAYRLGYAAGLPAPAPAPDAVGPASSSPVLAAHPRGFHDVADLLASCWATRPDTEGRDWSEVVDLAQYGYLRARAASRGATAGTQRCTDGTAPPCA